MNPIQQFGFTAGQVAATIFSFGTYGSWYTSGISRPAHSKSQSIPHNMLTAKQSFIAVDARVLADGHPAVITGFREFISNAVTYIESISVKRDDQQYTTTLHPEKVRPMELCTDRHGFALVYTAAELRIAEYKKLANVRAHCPCGKHWVVAIAHASPIVAGPCQCQALQHKEDEAIDSDSNDYRERY